MKKLGILCLAILFISTVSAIDFNITPTYPQGGAIITKLSGSFQEVLTKDDFSFYRNHVRVPMDFDLKKIQDEYYLYVSLENKEQNNYSILIEEVKFLKGAKVVTEDVQRNFTITDTVADFSINKGFVMTEDDFSIIIQNLEDKKMNVTSKFNSISSSKELYSGEISELKFSVKDVLPQSIQTLELKADSTTYLIPVYILGVPELKQLFNFTFDVNSLNVTLDLNSEIKRTVYLENTGEEMIFQIKLSLDEELEKYATLSKTELFNLSSGFLYPIEISFFSDDLPRKVHGYLTARSSSLQDSIFINLSFSPGYESLPGETFSKTCSEIGGFSCPDSSLCNGEIVVASDGNCCPTSCGLSDSESSSSFLKYFGWLLLIVLVAGGIWFYFKKYRNAEASPKGIFKFLTKREPRRVIKDEE